jgi:valyl-tRNA synthetase
MILSTTYATGQVPFRTVYLHGLIRAEDGKKMSKSRPESIIDPLHVIPKYGTDALRMALIMGVTPGNDQNWGWGKIEANRNFCNKLWNIARYVEGKTDTTVRMKTAPEPQTVADQWILTALHGTVTKIADDIEHLRFSEAYDGVYHFVWDDFADWYIEASKASPNPAMLMYVLECTLKIVHPFAPFVTETIWQTLRWEPETVLATAAWPATKPGKRESVSVFDRIKKLVSEIRSIKNVIGTTEKLRLYYQGDLNDEEMALVKQLARLSTVTEGEQGIRLLASDASTTFRLDIDKQTIEHYKAKLASEQVAAAQAVERLEGRLKNKQYLKKAPESLVADTQQQLETARARLSTISQDQKRFSSEL